MGERKEESPAVSATAWRMELGADGLPRSESTDDDWRYQILRRIGSGGMGSVFLAFHRGWAGVNGLVAIKRLHPHLLDDPEYVDMFFDEAEIGSRINHPNVARVFDFGMLVGAPFLAMELLQGKQLSELRNTLFTPTCPLSPEERFALVARIVSDAAAGLHAAHELRGNDGELLNVVHRDVSPQNILVTFDGISKILDFGTVKAELQQHRTKTGFFKGKCAYVAPDSLLGRKVDRRTDVWSLGVVLWELLTGGRLFARQSDGQTLRAVLEGDVPHPCDIDEDVPLGAAEVALKALQREPGKRYASTRELAAELEKVGGVATASSAVVSNWLDRLYPGQRQKAQDDNAQLAWAGHPTTPEEETLLWVEVNDDPTPLDDEETSSSPAIEVAVASSIQPPATAPARPQGPLRVGSRRRAERRERRVPREGGTPSAAPTTLAPRQGSTPVVQPWWRQMALILVAAGAGLFLGRLLPAQPLADAAASLSPPPATTTPAAVLSVPAIYELWMIGPDGRRRLVWRDVPPPAPAADFGEPATTADPADSAEVPPAADLSQEEGGARGGRAPQPAPEPSVPPLPASYGRE